MDDWTILQGIIGALFLAIFLLVSVVFWLVRRQAAHDAAIAALSVTVSALTEIVAPLLEGDEP